VNPNYQDINVENALADPDSIFYYYKKLIELRKQHEIIVYGSYTILAEENEQVYAYLRTLGEEQLLVVLNFFGDSTVFELPSTVKFQAKELLIANYEVNAEEEINTIQLRPYEARVYKLK
jgi:oligo-1,6-glucosidase